jgi:uncharacterized membrane protein YdfJ with MMPL/SSD domain
MAATPSMTSGPTAATRRRARWTLMAAGVIALLGLVGGAIASPRLTSSLSDYDAPGSAVVLAQHQIQLATGANPEEGYEVVVRATAPISDSSPLPSRVATVVALLKARPEVKRVLDYSNTGDSTMISNGGTFTVVVGTVGAVQETKAVTALQAAVAAQPSLKGNVWLGGPTVADVQIASVSSKDLGRAELLVLPFLFVLLFFVFRGVLAASLPLIGAVFAIVVTLGVMGLVTAAVPISVFALNLVIALGLGLAVDFSLLIVSRFREEYHRQGSAEAALATVHQTAGRTVLFSSITIAAAMATLVIFPERFIYSMGLAGAIVVLAAGAFALFVLPSILVLHGHRITASSRWYRAPTIGEVRSPGRWYRIAKSVMRRPVIWATVAVLVLVLLAAPLLRVSFTGGDASSLPATSSASAAYQLIQSKFTHFSEAPVGLVVDSSNVSKRGLTSFAAAAAAIPGVKAVSTFEPLGGSLWEADVALTRAPLSPAAQDAVNALQTLHPPSGNVTVIGQTASFVSLQQSLRSHIPLVLGLIVLIALVMLFAMTRSVVLPIVAVLMNLLTIAATFGLLVRGFQWGELSRALGFASPGAVQATSLIIISAVVFGLSTDYGVFLFGRIKEEHDAGVTPDEAVAIGLDHTGGIVSAAACCLALAVGALVLSQLVFVKELGLGVAFAVILDATLVRAILLPAIMKLLGPAAWWCPAWLGRAPNPASLPNRPLAPAALMGADIPGLT